MRHLLAAVCAAFLLSTPTAAHAQAACGPRAVLVERLAERFDERPIAMGLTNDGGVLEVFVSPGGTWSFLLSLPQGRTCLVASGDSWEIQPVPPPPARPGESLAL